MPSLCLTTGKFYWSLETKGGKKFWKRKRAVDFYAGELNTMRIAEYKKLNDVYDISESSIRDIFCRGIDFAVKIMNENK